MNKSYLSQVRILKDLSKVVLMRYPIQVKEIKFINHGENTTFKVLAANDKKYLLRIHREGYHSLQAIIEELRWLKRLSNKKILVPQPIFTKDKKLVVTAELQKYNFKRNCSLLSWTEGRFVNKKITKLQAFEVGRQIAVLHKHSKLRTSRTYWEAEGLVGLKAKMGSISKLPHVTKVQQNLLNQFRKKVYSALRKIQKDKPDKLGLIHADPHYGNILFTNNKVAFIDFDDCGYGFLIYDLVVNYLSMENVLGKNKKHFFSDYKQTLMEGYNSLIKLDSVDIKLFDLLVLARKISMLAWLNSRSDNPVIKKHLKPSIKRTLSYLKNLSVKL